MAGQCKTFPRIQDSVWTPIFKLEQWMQRGHMWQLDPNQCSKLTEESQTILQCWTSLLVIQVKDIIISGSFDSSSAWGQCPSTAPPFTTSLSNANTPSSFGRNFHITFTHWQEHSSVQPYKTSLQEYYNTNCPLLNYLILISTLYLWCCRSNQTLPIITAFSSKVKIKYETEKYICVETNTMEKFLKKWTLPLDSVP